MSFDALARHYRWMEFLLAGERLQSCRTFFLDQVADARRVLVLGEGHGRFLSACRRRLRQAQITCLDSSRSMLAVTRLRLQRQGLGSPQVRYVRADAMSWAAPERAFDLIVTHFFLDCFTARQVHGLVDTFSRAATLGASWCLADFRIPERGWPRIRAQAIHKLMYAFFRCATGLPARVVTPPDAALRRNGFVLEARKLSEWGMLHTDLWKRVPGAAAADPAEVSLCGFKGNRGAPDYPGP